MNQKSSLREVPQFVTRVLTVNTIGIHYRSSRAAAFSCLPIFARAACVHLRLACCMGDADRPDCAVGLTLMEKVIVLLTPN
jgi:hypothetical protein